MRRWHSRQVLVLRDISAHLTKWRIPKPDIRTFGFKCKSRAPAGEDLKLGLDKHLCQMEAMFRV